MDIKYSLAVKAGVIGGVLLALCHIVSFIFTVLGFSSNIIMMISAAVGCIIFFLLIAIAAGTGALAVKYAAPYVHNINDSLPVSAAAGLVAGLISAVIQIVIAFITPMFTAVNVTNINSNDIATGVAGSAIGGMGAMCCAPVTIVIVIVLSIIGGLAYTALVLKR